MIRTIVTQTPIYVWAILLYILVIGWRATKPRIIWVPKLFFIPFILTISKLPKLFTLNLVYTLTPLVAGLLIGTIAGSQHKKLEFLVSQNAVRLPGSYTTLIMFLILFTVKYGLNVLQDIDPTWCLTCTNLDIILTLIFAGYSFSKATTYTIRFFKAKRKNK